MALAIGRSRAVPPSTRLAARLAGLFVVIALVSRSVVEAPGIAMVGLYQQGTGWVFVAGLAGLLGARHPSRRESTRTASTGHHLLRRGERHRRGAPADRRVSTGSASPSTAAALSDGLQANPFELGALMAAALGLLVEPLHEPPARVVPPRRRR